MKKIVIPFMLIASSLFALAGCDSEKIVQLEDSDFDGLINKIDPDPNNNVYKFHMEDEDKEAYTKQDSFEMDYREFFREDLGTKYNQKLAKLASLILNESYGTNFVIENNVYTSESSSTSKILTQIGCNNIEYVDLTKENIISDVNDIVNLKLGHHTVINENNKKLNVTFVEVIGYPTSGAGWASNFDFGADTKDYVETTGEHKDWKDKKNHKGFEVSAQRAFERINKYLDEHKIKDVDNFVYVTGHSRSAAVSSLIGKKLKDNNIKSIIYAYNTPTHVADTSKEVCESYNNIWQLINEDDFVSEVPLKTWNNFTYLGHILKYKMADYADVYNDYFLDRSYPSVDDNLNKTLLKAITNIITSREAAYVFRDIDPDYEEVILGPRDAPFNSEEAANKAIESYYEDFKHPEAARKIIEMSVKPYSLNEKKFQINYKTKPQMIVSLIGDIIEEGSPSIFSIVTTAKAYLPFFGRYLNDISDEMDYFMENLTDNIDQIAKAHDQHNAFIANTLVK